MPGSCCPVAWAVARLGLASSLLVWLALLSSKVLSWSRLLLSVSEVLVDAVLIGLEVLLLLLMPSWVAMSVVAGAALVAVVVEWPLDA